MKGIQQDMFTRSTQNNHSLSIVLSIALLAFFSNAPGHGEPEIEAGSAKETSRWRDAIAAFEKEDQTIPPVTEGILLTGSSTARMWDLKKSFPDIVTLNRGFGGSQFVDVTLFAGEIIGKHTPQTIIVYSGDNDIHSGKSPETVAEEGVNCIKSLRIISPKSHFILLGIKPSKARWEHYPAMSQANALMEQHCASIKDVLFVDLGHLLLDNEGLPDSTCYLKDDLHLSEEGYRRWSEALKPLLHTRTTE